MGMGMAPKSDMTRTTQALKNKPLLPAHRISPTKRSLSVTGAAIIPS